MAAADVIDVCFYFLTGGFFRLFYSTLFHLPPLRFHPVGGCWDWTDVKDDPHVLGLPDPDPLVRGTDPDPSHFYKDVERTKIMLKIKF